MHRHNNVYQAHSLAVVCVTEDLEKDVVKKGRGEKRADRIRDKETLKKRGKENKKYERERGGEKYI